MDTSHVHSLADIVEIPVLPKINDRFSANSDKFLPMFFADLWKKVLIVIWNLKEPWRAKTVLQKNSAGRVTLTQFKTWLQRYIIRAVCYWQKDRHKHWWNRTVTPKQTLAGDFYMSASMIQGQWTAFSPNGAAKTGHPHAKTETGPFLDTVDKDELRVGQQPQCNT